MTTRPHFGCKLYADYGLTVDRSEVVPMMNELDKAEIRITLVHTIPIYRVPGRWTETGVPEERRWFCRLSAEPVNPADEYSVQFFGEGQMMLEISDLSSNPSGEVESYDYISSSSGHRRAPTVEMSDAIRWATVTVRISAPLDVVNDFTLWGVYLQTRADGDEPTWGIRRTSAGKQLTQAYMPITPYHMKMLMTDTLNTLMYEAGAFASIPACGKPWTDGGAPL